MARFKINRTDKKKVGKIPTMKATPKKKPKNTRKCYVCSKDSIGSYTVDLDIKGLAFCKKHKQVVGSAMLWLILGIPEIAEKTINDAKTEKVLVRKPIKRAHSKNAPKGKRG